MSIITAPHLAARGGRRLLTDKQFRGIAGRHVPMEHVQMKRKTGLDAIACPDRFFVF